MYFNDTRTYYDFKDRTFSGYLKTEVVKECKKKILDCRPETAIFLAFELMACGETKRVFSIIEWIYTKKIGIMNPVFPFRFFRRFKQYLLLRKNILESNGQFTKKGFKKSDIERMTDLSLRNSISLRNHISELITICCDSRKETIKSIPKYKPEEFQSNVIRQKIRTKDQDFVSRFIRPGDSPEIRMAMNEIAWAIHEKKTEHFKYWLGWLFQWEVLLLKNGIKLNCAPRNHIHNTIDAKDVTWLVWEILLHFASKMENKIYQNVSALYALYKYDWTTTKKKGRICYMLIVFDYLTQLYSIHKPITSDTSRYIKNSAYYLPIIEQMKKKEIVEEKSSLFKIDEMKKREELITKEELPLSEKQREKRRKKIEVKKSEAKLLTVHKLDSQLSR